METPLISIVVPTYNRREILEITLNSIFNQTYKNWECLVVDDGSTDNTAELLHTISGKDPRFIFLKNSRKKGAQGARNTGLKKARGEYIYFFDSDNFMKPNTLESLSDLLSAPNIDIAVCHANVVNQNQEITGAFSWTPQGNIRNQLLTGGTYVDFNISLIKKKPLDQFGLLDEECPAYQEWDTHIRLSEYCEYATLPEKLIDYYQGADDTISSDTIKSAKGYLYVLTKHQQLFANNLKQFQKLGLKLLNSIETSPNFETTKEIRQELEQLIPSFKAFLLRDRIMGRLNKIKHKIKSFKQ